jgi:HPt (histidine-containing phosphotransfer) domain-containing protein
MHVAGEDEEMGHPGCGRGAAVDLEAVMDSLEGDLGLIRSLTEVFLRDCPLQVEQLRSALARRDARSTELAAHKLKGSLGIFGARRAAAMALGLENAAGEEGWDCAVRLFCRLEREVRRVCLDLEPYAG